MDGGWQRSGVPVLSTCFFLPEHCPGHSTSEQREHRAPQGLCSSPGVTPPPIPEPGQREAAWRGLQPCGESLSVRGQDIGPGEPMEQGRWEPFTIIFTQPWSCCIVLPDRRKFCLRRSDSGFLCLSGSGLDFPTTAQTEPQPCSFWDISKSPRQKP